MNSGPAEQPHPLSQLEEAIASILELPSVEQAGAFDCLQDAHPGHAELLRQWRQAIQAVRPVAMGSQTFTDKPPDRIGDYRVLGVLGHGGMGRVYLAEQQHPVRRPVALKVIKQGMDSDQVLRRFELERQALAVMNHDNVARVFDAGTTTGGQPFFAMEFVAGEPITTFADQRSLDVRQRVQLFRHVCAGVQHAHQKGVIHRDLKPGNVLVSDQQGRSVPKIIDFGLARAIDQDLLQNSLMTEQGVLIGTPEYMAPEQALLDGSQIDTRADIYSLGAMLYELLSGVLPFPSSELRKLGLADVQRRIRGVDPAKPSSQVGAPRRELRGELDWIVLKAMAKDPERRYQSASELSDDLERHLQHEPVLAGPPSTVYKLRKFVRRHRVQVIAGATVFVTLLVGGVATAVFALETQRVLNREERSRQQAHVAGLAAWRTAESKLRELEVQTDTVKRALASLDKDKLDRQRNPDTDWHAIWRQRDALRDRVVRGNTQAAYLHAELLDAVSDAARLAPELAARSAELKLQANVVRWRLAKSMEESRGPEDKEWLGGTEESKFYSRLILAADKGGKYAAELHPMTSTFFDTSPRGADAYVFQYRSLAELFEGADDRLVPVPYRVDPKSLPVPPGQHCLRVVRDGSGVLADDVVVRLAGHTLQAAVFVLRGTGDIRRGDRLVTIDGRDAVDVYTTRSLTRVDKPHEFVFASSSGRIVKKARDLTALGVVIGDPRRLAEGGNLQATVYRDGVLREVRLLPGAGVRMTAAPVFLTPKCRVGKTQMSADLPSDYFYLVVYRQAGHETMRKLVRPGPSECVEMPRRGSGPRGFVPVSYQLHHPGRSEPVLVWIMDREVTAAEYLEFLNDSGTLAAVGRSKVPIRFPRTSASALTGGFWPRDEGGRFRLPAQWHADMPVSGVSWEDARAYAEWLTARSRQAGQGWTFDLPGRSDWGVAVRCPGPFPWGSRFRPDWTKSCWARSVACREPVLSFATDETPSGIFDTSGSVEEWLRDFLGEGSPTFMGSSWMHWKPERFRPSFINGAPTNACGEGLGFRLVAMKPKSK